MLVARTCGHGFGRTCQGYLYARWVSRRVYAYLCALRTALRLLSALTIQRALHAPAGLCNAARRQACIIEIPAHRIDRRRPAAVSPPAVAVATTRSRRRRWSRPGGPIVNDTSGAHDLVRPGQPVMSTLSERDVRSLTEARQVSQSRRADIPPAQPFQRHGRAVGRTVTADGVVDNYPTESAAFLAADELDGTENRITVAAAATSAPAGLQHYIRSFPQNCRDDVRLPAKPTSPSRRAPDPTRPVTSARLAAGAPPRSAATRNSARAAAG